MDRKRARRGGSSAARRGMLASIKFNKLQPWPAYGAARIQRGSPWSLANFGPSMRTATAEQRAFRRQTGFTGRGLYSGRGKFDWKGLESAGSRFFRKTIPAIESMGDRVLRSGTIQKLQGIAQGFSGGGLYSGRGLYGANNLISGAGSRESMSFESPNDETQSLILTHKEYVGDIFGPGSAAFSNTAYAINPGLSAQFPFLAQFAANFDEYELIQMVFEFHSTVDATATNNNSGNTGTIIMATNYKSDASLFLTKEEMIQYHGGVSGRLTDPLQHGVECDPNKNALGGAKFVRTQPVANTDIKTYDSGIFQLAIQNCPQPFQNNQIGELWVHYKVKLSKPKLMTALQNNVSGCRFVSRPGDTLTGAKPLGSADSLILYAFNNTVPVFIQQLAGGVIRITFPSQLSGIYDILFVSEGVFVTKGTDVEPSYGGLVTGWNDLYGTPATTSTVVRNPASFVGQFSTSGAVYNMRVKVNQATTGTNNIVDFLPFGNSPTITSVAQSYVEIKEVGSQYSTNNSINYPIWVTQTGVQTTV